MVSYQLAPEQQDLRDSVAQFARDVVAPVIGGYYERGEFPYDIVARMGKLGLFGLPFPEEYGGMGGDYFALCLALEELARVDSSVAITLEAGVSLGAMPIYRFGTEDQRRRWLPELCAGERLAAFGLTEPGGGSDIPGGMRTTARLEDNYWVIDGSKAFITNAGTSITSLVTVLAITGRDEQGRKEISSVIVPAGTAGFVPGPEYSKVGWCASDTRELSFADCRVPADNLSVSAAGATRSSCGSWTRAGWRSPRWPPASLKAAWTNASGTPGSARRSATGLMSTRPSSSPSPTWRRGPTSPGWPGTTRPPG